MADELLFSRRVRVTVDLLEVEDLRVTFKAKKTWRPEPNTLELQIFNLSASTRAQMLTAGSRVVVEAGYDQVLDLVFSGQARTTDHKREWADWVTLIQCGDGETQYKTSRVSESWAPGTKASDVLLKLASSMGLDTGNLKKQIAKGNFRGAIEQFVHGFSAHGKSRDELDTLTKTLGMEWSIQDGKMQFLRAGETTDSSAVVLNADSGLIGSPEHAAPQRPGLPQYLKLKCLLNAQIQPGVRLRVDSLQTRGDYRAMIVTHDGDSSSGSWYTEVEAIAL